jgi:hypothetical protein
MLRQHLLAVTVVGPVRRKIVTVPPVSAIVVAVDVRADPLGVGALGKVFDWPPSQQASRQIDSIDQKLRACSVGETLQVEVKMVGAHGKTLWMEVSVANLDEVLMLEIEQPTYQEAWRLRDVIAAGLSGREASSSR